MNKTTLPIFTQFSQLESSALKPLLEQREIQIQAIPLRNMAKWELTSDGILQGTHFLIEGVRTSFAPESGHTEPAPWDQPLYRQGGGTLVLAIDEDDSLLVKALFEPGNATRGYQNKGLILCTSCKFSPANLAQQQARGRIPAFSDLLDEPSVEIVKQCRAPGDGARANKENTHYLVRTSRALLEEKYQKLDPAQQPFFFLLHREVLLECYTRGLVGEHLRDLLSLLLFVKE